MKMLRVGLKDEKKKTNKKKKQRILLEWQNFTNQLGTKGDIFVIL